MNNNMSGNSFKSPRFNNKDKQMSDRLKSLMAKNRSLPNTGTSFNNEVEEYRLSTEFKSRKSKKHSTEKRNYIKQSLKIYKDIKDKKKENDKYNY